MNNASPADVAVGAPRRLAELSLLSFRL